MRLLYCCIVSQAMGKGEELLNEITESHDGVVVLEDSLPVAVAVACHL